MDPASASVLALQALAWTLANPERAERLLAITGLSPAGLRASAAQAATQAAVLQFVLGHEADVCACAAALAVPPAALSAAAATLAGGAGGEWLSA